MLLLLVRKMLRSQTPTFARKKAHFVLGSSMSMLSIVLAVLCSGFPTLTTGAQSEGPLPQVGYSPPFYEISSTSLYDSGVQLGQKAASHMRSWLASPEMLDLLAFASGKGLDIFEELKSVNTQAFPQYAEELTGIAAGANVSLDAVWAANMLGEMEVFMPEPTYRSGHCSDIFALSQQGYGGGFAHGHNEDWPGIVKDHWYFVKYTALPGADFSSCAGMVYPASILGWATTWNAHGLYLTQNSLFAREASSHGLLSAFVQRDAICGLGKGKSMDSVLSLLTKDAWSYGASVNVVDLNARRMANVEMHEADFAVLEVSESMGNYSHFNMYKNLFPGKLDPPRDSSLHRQARADALPPPRTRKDVMERLSDAADTNYPIFRNMTLSTFILDGATGQLEVWCCGHNATGLAPAIFSWNIHTFFTSRMQSISV